MFGLCCRFGTPCLEMFLGFAGSIGRLRRLMLGWPIWRFSFLYERYICGGGEGGRINTYVYGVSGRRIDIPGDSGVKFYVDFMVGSPCPVFIF